MKDLGSRKRGRSWKLNLTMELEDVRTMGLVNVVRRHLGEGPWVQPATGGLGPCQSGKTTAYIALTYRMAFEFMLYQLMIVSSPHMKVTGH